MRLSTLRKSAASSTASRGHRMRWQNYGADDTFTSATCKRCGMSVYIDTRPADGIDIHGQAVALNCVPSVG